MNERLLITAFKILLVLGAGLAVYFFSIRPSNLQIEKHFQEFPTLTTKDELSGTVVAIVSGPPELRGSPCSFVLETGEKHRIFHLKAIGSGEEFLEIATVGSYLAKKEGNDTLSVVKQNFGDTIIYNFVIN